MTVQKTRTEHSEVDLDLWEELIRNKHKCVRPADEFPALKLINNGIGPCSPLEGVSEETLEAWRKRNN